MALSTFDELKASVRDWLARPDLTDSTLEDMIAMAEARHRREMRLRAMETVATASAPTGSRRIQLPDGFIEMRRLAISEATGVSELQPVSQNQILEFNRAGSGRPSYFSVANEIEFDVTPDSEYTLEMVYYKALDALSASNPTNWILTNAKELYLYGCLIHASLYLDNDMLAKVASLYEAAALDVQYQDETGRYSGGTLESRTREYS